MLHSFYKIKTFIWSFLVLASTLTATQGSSSCCCIQPSVDIRTGYFFFSDSKMRKIYDKGGWDLRLSASYPFRNLSPRWCLSAYGAVGYIHRSGSSIHGKQTTSLGTVPVTIGLKAACALNAKMRYTCALGPNFFTIYQHNRSSYVYKDKSRSNLGFFINTGFDYLPCEHFRIVIFGEYAYGQIRFHGGKSRVYTRNIQVGGFTFGGGVGYEF